jgi:hypothetical protein
MYSRREVCFTVVLAVGVWPSFNSNRDTVRASSHGPRLAVADGTQPPPPILPPPKSGSAARLRADVAFPSAPWRSDA